MVSRTAGVGVHDQQAVAAAVAAFADQQQIAGAGQARDALAGWDSEGGDLLQAQSVDHVNHAIAADVNAAQVSAEGHRLHLAAG